MRSIMYLTVVFGLLSAVSAVAVDIKVDFGGAGTLSDNEPPDVVGAWTQWSEGSGNLTVDGITLTLSNGSLNGGAKIRSGEWGQTDNLTKDALSEEDPGSGGWYEIQITGLTEGASYIMRSYHDNLWAEGSFPTSTVSMKLNDTEVATANVSERQPYTNAGVCEFMFTAGAGGDTFKWDFAQSAFFNGFILLTANPSVQFETAASGALEAVSPAILNVVLSEEQAETVTVDYSVTGGTATSGEDYTPLADGTLNFDPGQTSKTINIDIINDGLDEDNETIEVTLSNVTGGEDAELGKTPQHVYTILDPRPRIAFEAAAGNVDERTRVIHRPTEIPVRLSVSPTVAVTVDYSVTGGTAARDTDYTLADGTLSFAPGETTANIVFNIMDDNTEEPDETIELTLSNASIGSMLGTIPQHTVTIVDGGNISYKVDVNDDGEVDFDDVIAVIENWLECTLNPHELCLQ